MLKTTHSNKFGTNKKNKENTHPKHSAEEGEGNVWAVTNVSV